jgi:CHASE2 domain-containing sensor protein
MLGLIRRFFRFFFKADYVYCTIVVFGFMLVISQILEKFSFLNPIEIALSDFEMTDIVFARNIREEPDVDTNIVLVNIGNISRRGIAREIERIAAEKPKVLGIDCSFFKLKKPDDDSMLVSALSKIDKLVLFSKLDMTEKSKGDRFDTLLFCHPTFARLGNSGFCNIITPGKDEYQTCRTFKPVDSVGGHIERAFAVEIARLVSPEKVDQFLSRKKDYEIINFRGNQDHFYCLDVPDLLGHDDGSGFVTEPELNISLKDKIVLMGYMGDRFGPMAKLTREDKFHTPMNENYAGKAYPDMFGVVIHANIVSMILHNQPIDSMSGTGGILLAILLCYLNVIFFFYIHESYPSWYDLVVKTTQVLEVFLILGLAVIIYARYSYSLDVTLAAIAVGLCGDILEVYTGAMYNIVGRLRDRIRNILFRKAPATPEEPADSLDPSEGEPSVENSSSS